jgi:hypothetical protein
LVARTRIVAQAHRGPRCAGKGAALLALRQLTEQGVGQCRHQVSIHGGEFSHRMVALEGDALGRFQFGAILRQRGVRCRRVLRSYDSRVVRQHGQGAANGDEQRDAENEAITRFSHQLVDQETIRRPS